MGIIVNEEHLERAVLGPCRRESIRVVLTNGCFDVLHRGHVETLRFARRQGDVLIVAVNTDEAVRALKGPHRPMHALRDRMEVLCALGSVDYVIPFGTAAEPSVEPLVERLRPDVLVKGGDYSVDGVVGAAVVTRHGGRVVVAPKVPGASTSETLRRVEGSENPSTHLPIYPSTIDYLLVDLDGVLVDFVGSMARVLGRPFDEATCRGQYDPGKLFDCDTDLFSVFGSDFWETADWMPDGKAIWQACRECVPEDRILLCSSPTHEPGSCAGKLKWIERELGDAWCRRYVLTPVKEALARPGVLLIDDSDAVVERFRAAGGQAMLYPRPWNALWEGCDTGPDIARGWIRLAVDCLPRKPSPTSEQRILEAYRRMMRAAEFDYASLCYRVDELLVRREADLHVERKIQWARASEPVKESSETA